MMLALGARQHLFDVVETADQAGAEIEAARAKAFPRGSGPVHRIKTDPERLVDHHFESPPSLSNDPRQPRRDVGIERQRCSHVLMLQI